MRVYVRRTTQVRRVNTREDREEGLLGIRPAFYTERVEPGDLLVAGSRAVFNSESVERVGQALAEAPSLPVAQVVALLHESSVKRGVGGGSLALRFPQF